MRKIFPVLVLILLFCGCGKQSIGYTEFETTIQCEDSTAMDVTVTCSDEHGYMVRPVSGILEIYKDGQDAMIDALLMTAEQVALSDIEYIIQYLPMTVCGYLDSCNYQLYEDIDEDVLLMDFDNGISMFAFTDMKADEIRTVIGDLTITCGDRIPVNTEVTESGDYVTEISYDGYGGYDMTVDGDVYTLDDGNDVLTLRVCSLQSAYAYVDENLSQDDLVMAETEDFICDVYETINGNLTVLTMLDEDAVCICTATMSPDKVIDILGHLSIGSAMVQ